MATRPAKPRKPAKRPPPRKPVFKGTPLVIVDFVFEHGELFLAIANIGDAPAVKVTTTFSAPIRGVMGSVNINALALFQNIEFLAPHKTIRTFIDSSAAYFGRDEPRRIAVRIAYRDMANQAYESTLQHDLNMYADIGYVERAREPTPITPEDSSWR